MPVQTLGGSGTSPATLIVGPAGVGRSHALRRLRMEAISHGRPTLELCLSPADSALPWHAAARLTSELGRLLPAGKPEWPARSVVAEADGPNLVGEIARALHRVGENLVILVDDLQWIDDRSARIFAQVVRALAGSNVRLYGSARLPLGVPNSIVDALLQSGLVIVRTIRPLSTGQIEALATDVLGAVPHRSLLGELSRMSRGIPAAVLSALEAFLRAGAIRIIERQAWLVDSSPAPAIPASHALLQPVRSLPAIAWSVGATFAALDPLGEAAIPIIATRLGIDEGEIQRVLGLLEAARIVRHGANGWRFVVPAIAAGLRQSLGPFQRRRLAQYAIEAMWSGHATANPAYRCEQLVVAGRLVDPNRSARELIVSASRLAMTDPRAARWINAAVELADDEPLRSEALISRAIVADRQGDYAQVLRSLDAIPENVDDRWLDAELMRLRAQQGIGDTAALERAAAGRPGTSRSQAALRAAALMALGRGGAAARLIAEAVPGSSGGGRVAAFGAELARRPGAVTGIQRGGAECQTRRDERPVMLRQLGLVSEIWMLLTLGDLNDVEAMLKLHQMTDGNLPWSEQILLAWRRGDWNAAVDHAGSAEAWQVPVGSAVADGPVCRAMAEILLARGRPERARMLLHSARATGATLPCLLDIAAADIDMALGASARARKTLMAAAGAASRSRVRVATDEIWLRYTELARGQGDRLAARRGLRETGLAALQVDTDSSRLHHQLATVAVEGNLDAAREATRIARKLNQPYLLARTLERLVSWEASPAALLHEAHERLGALDALLDRARVRTLMRRFRLTVPNRAATVAENERILAILVAEALANRQLAMALHITEKSVESRLTRLFAHAGHRSRVDLATAMTSRAAAATWNPRASKEDVSRREAREPAPECAGGSTRTDAIGHVGPPGDE